jgi:hypothetical protein
VFLELGRSYVSPFCSGWFGSPSCMADDISDQDVRLSLARAFDRAWEGYYRARRPPVSRDIARTELARRLVQLSREGVRDETKLSVAGLKHLNELNVKDGIVER